MENSKTIRGYSQKLSAGKVIALFFSLLFSINLSSQNIDIRLLREINLNRNKSLDGTFRGITHSLIPVIIGTPAVVYSVGLIKKDSTLKQKGIFIGEAILVSGFISTALKYSINRERPFATYTDIEKATGGGTPSFPSGHTSDAFATATSLSITFPKWYVITPSFVWASAVAYSRMHLGVHYPSDVLTGAIIGSGSAYLSYKLNKWVNKKINKEKLYYRKT